MCELLLCTPVYSTGVCDLLDSEGKITLVPGVWPIPSPEKRVRTKKDAPAGMHYDTA